MVETPDTRPPKGVIGRAGSAAGRGIGWLAKLVLPAAILAASVFGLQAMRGEGSERPSFERRERAAPITTARVAYRDVAPRVDLFGELVASRTVELRAPVPGEVVEVHPALVSGGVIGAGDTVIAIDTFDYEGAVVQARANLDEALARVVEVESRVALETTLAERAAEQLAVVEEDVERFQQLLQRGSATEAQLDAKRLELSARRQTVDQRQANITIERARLDQAEAQVERLAWQLEVAERDLARTTLTVPFDAVVREANAEIGKRLSANDIVAVLYDPRSLEARFALPDALYGRLLGEGDIIGRPVEIRWRLGQDVRKTTGEIVRVGADIAAERGGVDVYALIDEADASLRPGAFLEVGMSDVMYQGVLTVPEAAVYDGARVYTVAEERLAGHDIEIVASVPEGFLVRADIPSGAPLMTSRMTEAGDGVLVQDVDAPGIEEDTGPLDEDAVMSERSSNGTGSTSRSAGSSGTGPRSGANAGER